MNLLDQGRLERIRSAYKEINRRAKTDRRFNQLVMSAIEEESADGLYQYVRRLAKKSTVPVWLALSLEQLLWDRDIRRKHGGMLIGELLAERQRVLDMCDRHLNRLTGALGELHRRRSSSKGKITGAQDRVRELRGSLREGIQSYLNEHKTGSFDGFLVARPEYNIPQISDSDECQELFVDLQYRHKKC